jgi:hypothetical protein
VKWLASVGCALPCRLSLGLTCNGIQTNLQSQPLDNSLESSSTCCPVSQSTGYTLPQLINRMSVHANFWNPTNALRFHRQITKLYKWNGAPASPVNYRHLKQHESSRYVLSTAEEIHLADHIAFLAQRKSGPKNVSAVTIEEHCGKDGGDSRMIIRIAANRTPQKEVVTGLMGIMEIVARYAAAGEFTSKFDLSITFNVVYVMICRKFTRHLV